MKYWQAWMACALLMCVPAAAQADIFRWDNAQQIPGTQGVTPGPGIDLSSRNTAQRNLRFADFSGGLDLSQANFWGSWLDSSRFNGANLTNAELQSAILTNADLSGANLTNAYLGNATLTSANFAGAVIQGTEFWRGDFPGGGSGITLTQLYSTASYQQENLRSIGLRGHDLTGGNFSALDLAGAVFTSSKLTGANLSGTNLIDADLHGATLTNANLAGAVVTGAQFGRTTWASFTKEQLYSTASYQQRNLRDIGLGVNDLTGWDFSALDLAGADFTSSTLTSADFAGAVVAGANFARFSLGGQGSGITLPQLYSTASYQQWNLRGIGLRDHDLTGADFSGQDLTGADLGGSSLTSANVAGAVVAGANFARISYSLEFPGSGITRTQLYSTASYQQRNLRGIGLGGHDLTGVDFSDHDLTGAHLGGSTLTGANFAGAVVARANFARNAPGEFPGSGITLLQLYSTASYQKKDLRGIGLGANELTGGDFSGHDLTGANLVSSMLMNANLSGTNLTDAELVAANLASANLSGANLTDANLLGSTLTNANLAAAIVTGAAFAGTTRGGFTKEQLYSTASYLQRDLRGIDFTSNNLTGWDFSDQDLVGASFYASQVSRANFSFADLRDAEPLPSGAITRNSIRESGEINGLDLAAGETLVVRDSTIGITVRNRMNIVSGGTLELVLGDADWGSTMALAAGITPDLGGTLRVRFADHANLASMVGTTFDFFDWPAALDTNNRFDAIELPPGTRWDLNQLYLTGTATLTAIPEPSAVLLFACATAACAARRQILANRLRL
jgi:uncharacterized protein YjbI with pentapeptide repeats